MKMTSELKDLILEFELQKISEEEFISRLPFTQDQKTFIINNIFKEIISLKKSDDVEFGLTLLWTLEEENEFITILHELIIAPWHTRYEDIIHDLQIRKKSESIPFIKQAMQSKYEYLESYGTGTGQFISQCGHALKSIGTKEAVDVIIELSNSENKELSKAMKYRMSRMKLSPNLEPIEINKTIKENKIEPKRWWQFWK